MRLTIPIIESWDLDTVITQVDNLRSDEGWFFDSAEAVRSAADQNLDGFAGDTVSAATRNCSTLALDITILAGQAANAAEALADFCARAPGLRNELRAALEDAASAQCRVADDGTVRGPLLIGDPSDPAVIKAHEENDKIASGIENRIRPLLRDLEKLDRAAADALDSMELSHGAEVDSAPIDVRPVAASAVVNAKTDLVSTAAKSMDASSGIVRGLPVVGGLMGMTIGVATSPEDESLEESLLIEGSGAAAGTAAAGLATWATTVGVSSAMSALGTAGAGAAVGSAVPGLGTAVGFVVGAGIGIGAGLGVTTLLRGK